LNELKNFHPTGEIGTPGEVAELVKFLIQSKISFLNGSSIEIDGGISSVLHDPSLK
jgi:NAD(P)-dependent dehydrogenase (short-subunit alcohol dehydrogenase family)